MSKFRSTNSAGGSFQPGKPISAAKLNRMAEAVDRLTALGGPDILVQQGSTSTVSFLPKQNRISSLHPFRVYQKRTEQTEGEDGTNFTTRYYWMETGRFMGPY